MDFLYYGDNTVGYKDAQFCPVFRGATNELKQDYYVGSCSSLGRNGLFGTELHYYDFAPNGSILEWYYTDSLLDNKVHNSYTDHSFCYLDSITIDAPTSTGGSLKSKVIRPVCYESFCSSKSLTIKIDDLYYVCPRAGGNIQIYDGGFTCPDYYLICSGAVMCNNMYDCVTKKSETKEESYNLDYIPLTTQNISSRIYTEYDNNNNYELSDAGICPKYCIECSLLHDCEI